MANQKAEIVISARDETKIAFNSVKSSLGSLNGLAGGLSGSLSGFLPLLSATAFAGFVKGGIDTLDMLGDLSDRTGVAASTLAGFKLVAAQSDTSLEALGKGINKLSIFMAENGDAAKKLGLDAKDPAEAFIQLSNVLSGIDDVQQRAAIANKVLGKSYQELLPALLQGGDALRKQIEAGKEFSGVTPEAVKQAQEFNDQLDLLKTKAEAAGVSLAGPLLSGINKVITAWSNSSGIGFLAALDALDTKEADISKKITTTAARLRDLQKSYDNLDPKKSISNKINDVVFGDRNTLSAQISVAKAELKTLQGLEDARRDKLRAAEKSATGKSSSLTVDDFSAPRAKGFAKDADSEAAKRFIENLKKETETLGFSKVALLEYEAAHLKLNAAQKEIVAGLIAKNRAQEEAAKATEEEAAAEEERRKNIAETIEYQKQFNAEVESIKDSIDPTREYTRHIQKLGEMFNAGRLTADEFSKAAEMAQRNMLSFSAGTKDEFEQLKDAVLGFGKDSTDALVDFAFGASASFEDMANDFAKSITKMLVYKNLMEPLFSSISNGGSDLLSGLFGNIFGWMLGDTSGGVSATAGAYSIDQNPFLNFGGARALGGDVMSGKTYLVGERGPELFMPKGPGSIIPNNKLNGTSIGNVVMNFTVSGATDRHSQQMIAANAFQGLRKAAMRNT